MPLPPSCRLGGDVLCPSRAKSWRSFTLCPQGHKGCSGSQLNDCTSGLADAVSHESWGCVCIACRTEWTPETFRKVVACNAAKCRCPSLSCLLTGLAIILQHICICNLKSICDCGSADACVM